MQTYIQETKQAKTTLLIKNGQIGEVKYEFIGRRKEGNSKIEVFSIILKEEKRYKTYQEYWINKISMKYLPGRMSDSFARDIKNIDSSLKIVKLSKTKKMLSARSLGPKSVLGENIVSVIE